MDGIKAEVQALGHKQSAATTRAYANWTHPGMATYRRETIENGVEPIQVWSSEWHERKRKDGSQSDDDSDEETQTNQRAINGSATECLTSTRDEMQRTPPGDDFEIATRVLQTVERQIGSYRLGLEKVRPLRKEFPMDEELRKKTMNTPESMFELLI